NPILATLVGKIGFTILEARRAKPQCSRWTCSILDEHIGGLPEATAQVCASTVINFLMLRLRIRRCRYLGCTPSSLAASVILPPLRCAASTISCFFRALIDS